MPLPTSTPIAALASTLAVERLRRRAVYCAASVDLTDPSNHDLIGAIADTRYLVVSAVRHRAGATATVRPVAAQWENVNPTGRAMLWALLDVPAARIPAGLVWSQLGTSGQLDYATPTIAAPVYHPMNKALDTWLCGHMTAPLVGPYRCTTDGAQPLAAGRALLLVGARFTGTTFVEGQILVEVSDE
jgi:hypothetical protein